MNIQTITPATIAPDAWNCVAHSERHTGPDFARFTHLEISPCHEDKEQELTGTCAPQEVEFWTLYGRDSDGLAEALHDARSEQELATYLQAALQQSGGHVAYFDQENGYVEPGTVCGLIDTINGWLLDQVEGDAPWEDHPLDALRTALFCIDDCTPRLNADSFEAFEIAAIAHPNLSTRKASGIAVDLCAGVEPPDMQSTLIDALADIRHACDLFNLPFDALNIRAKRDHAQYVADHGKAEWNPAAQADRKAGQ